MIVSPTSLDGPALIDTVRRGDERGWFARVMCRETLAAHGLPHDFVQANHSMTRRRGSIRGLHFQRPPHAEAKLVRCVRGAIHDVIVDVREGSPTRWRWEAFALSAENGRMLIVPEGFAHGFQTLTDDAEVTYHVTHSYTPEAEGGLRHSDPALGIAWPLPVTDISAKDRAWPLLAAPAIAAFGA